MVKNILLVVAIALLSVFSLFSKGLPPTHDGEYHVIRFYEFTKTLLDGNIYPRWAPDLNNGFGVPLFNYVYPLPNYVAVLFHLLGSSFIDAFKLNMILAVILGSIFMYLWAREFWGNLGGIVASAFYSFSPYHLADIFIRGSVGEVWALSFFPAFLWSATRFLKTKDNFYFILSGIFLSLIIFSHNILALMFFVFSLFYISFFSFVFKNKSSFFKMISIFILGVSISSIFWIPALFEKQFVRGLEVYNYSVNFPEFYQLIFPSWGAGLAGDLVNGLSFQIGVANLLVFLLSFFLLFKRQYKKIVIFMIACFLVVFFLMLEISLPVWKIVPLMNYFQFPWRFLSLEIIIASFLAGGVSVLWKKNISAFILVALTILLGIGYIKPAYFLLRSDSYYTTRSNFIDGTNSPGNSFNTKWMGLVNKEKNKILTHGKITNMNTKSTKYSFSLDLKNMEDVIVNTAYFPNWTVYIDGKSVTVKVLKDGSFSFSSPRGKHFVLINLEDTPVGLISGIISLVSIVFVLLNMTRFVKIKR